MAEECAAGCRTQPAGRRRSPSELPVGKMLGAARGVEVGGGAISRTIAVGLDPSLGPADVILVGSGLDGQRVKALEETQACRGVRVRVTVRRSV